MVSVDDPFMREVRSTYGRLAYTHKTHEKEAESKAAAGHRLRVLNVVVFGVTAGATVLAPLLQSQVASWVAALSAIAGLVFAAVQLSFDPARDSAAHRAAAKSYLEIRNGFARLIADSEANPNVSNALRTRRDDLARQAQIVDDHAPQTSAAAYERARAALKSHEELTFSRAELDTLLPPASPADSSGEAPWKNVD